MLLRIRIRDTGAQVVRFTSEHGPSLPNLREDPKVRLVAAIRQAHMGNSCVSHGWRGIP